MHASSLSKGLRLTLWAAQALLALLLIGAGIFKLVTPLSTLAELWPWSGEHPVLVRATGVVDAVGGLGLVVPALLGFPRWTAWAALGGAALQVSAIAFHLGRGEAGNTPFNFCLLGLTLFVFWGHRRTVAVAQQ